jgi:ubiquitin-protein ligase
VRFAEKGVPGSIQQMRPMKQNQSFLLRLATKWSPLLSVATVSCALVAGCAEPAEEAPKDIEQARQEHINTTQRELEHSSSQP